VVWIVGDMEYCLPRIFITLGMEPVSVRVSSDAEHIITPSPDGPARRFRRRWRKPERSRTMWAHGICTPRPTPGDYSEMTTLRAMFPETLLVTARKAPSGMA